MADIGPFAWGAWRPDVVGPGSGFAQTAEGVVPIQGAMGIGYGTFPRLSQNSAATALSNTPRGICSVQAPDGNWYLFAATSSTIERLKSDFSFEVIDPGRSATVGDDVSFALFGTHLLFTDTTVGVKAYDVISGGAVSAVSGAPAARSLFVAHNTLFALGTSTSPRRFASANLGTYTQWSGGTADAKTLEDGGALVGGADLKNGAAVMFQERCIRGVQFGVGAAAYSISKVADGLGCVAERTIAAYDGRVAWWHEDGPWMMQAGMSPVPIGADKINRWAEESIGRDNFASLQGSADPQRKLFLWRIDGDRLLAYSWLYGEFSILPATTTAIARIASPPLTVDDLTLTLEEYDTPIDQLGGSGAPTIGGLNSSRKYSTFTGGNMSCQLESCSIPLGTAGLVTWVQPADDAPDGTLSVGVAFSEDQEINWSDGQYKNATVGRNHDGCVPTRARGSFVAFKRYIPAESEWTYANGIRKVTVN